MQLKHLGSASLLPPCGGAIDLGLLRGADTLLARFASPAFQLLFLLLPCLFLLLPCLFLGAAAALLGAPLFVRRAAAARAAQQTWSGSRVPMACSQPRRQRSVCDNS